MKRKVSSLLLFIMFFMQILSASVIAAPSVSISEPIVDSEFFRYDANYPATVTIRASVSGSPTSVRAYYVAREGAADNQAVGYVLGDLIREGSTNYYSNSFGISLSAALYPVLADNPPPISYYKPCFMVIATDSSGETRTLMDSSICDLTMSGYTNIDSTFSSNWYSPTNNQFISFSTGHPSMGVPQNWTYNCMAYALNRASYGWLWPWGGNPSDQQLINEMSSYGYNVSSPNPLSGTQVIYYSGGHFSRVVTWSSSGMPSQIVSKWGGLELIKSSNFNPFTSSYGQAHYYFKQN